MDIARSSLKVFLATVGGALLTFLGITLFARELGAAELGAFFLFQAALSIASIPADFGLRGAAEKRLSEGGNRETVLSTALLLKLLPLSLLVAGVLVFQRQLNDYFGAEFAVFLAVGLVLYDLSFLGIKVIQGELRVGETAILRFAYKLTWIGLGVTLTILTDFGALGLVYAYITGLSVLLVWGAARRSTRLGRPSWAAARSLYDYAKFNFVSTLGGTFYNWLDVAVIGFFLTNAHVGAYEVAWRVTMLVVLFSNAIGTTILSQFSEWDANGDQDRIEATITEVLTPALVFVIPAFFGTIVIAPELLDLVFGTEFSLAAVALVVLMGEKVFQAAHIILGRSLLALDRPDLAARASIVSLLANLVLNLVLIWQFGLVGAAVATLLASLVNGVLHYRYLARQVTVRIPYEELGLCVLAALGMTIAIVALRQVLVIDSVITLAAVIGTGVVVYGVLVLSSRTLRFKLVRYLPVVG